jgi:hypothetical protein
MNFQKDFYGTDGNNETSLFEYGLLASNDLDADNRRLVIFGVGIDEESIYNKFNLQRVAESDLNEIMNESWFNKNEFLKFVGLDEKQFLESDFVNKLSDLISYYGCENILGSVYYPMGEEETLMTIENYHFN